MALAIGERISGPLLHQVVQLFRLSKLSSPTETNSHIGLIFPWMNALKGLKIYDLIGYGFAFFKQGFEFDSFRWNNKSLIEFYLL